MEARDLLLFRPMESMLTAIDITILIYPTDSEEERTGTLNIDFTYFKNFFKNASIIIYWGDNKESTEINLSDSEFDLSHIYDPVTFTTERNIRVITTTGIAPTRKDKTLPYFNNRQYKIYKIGKTYTNEGELETDFGYICNNTLFNGDVSQVVTNIKNTNITNLSYAFSNCSNISADYKTINLSSFSVFPDLSDITGIFENSSFTNTSGNFGSNIALCKVTNAFRGTQIKNTNIFWNNQYISETATYGYTQYVFADNENFLLNSDMCTSGTPNLVDMTGWFHNIGATTILSALFNNIPYVEFISESFSDTPITELPDDLLLPITNLRYATRAFANTQLTEINDNLFLYNRKLEGITEIFDGTNIESSINLTFNPSIIEADNITGTWLVPVGSTTESTLKEVNTATVESVTYWFAGEVEENNGTYTIKPSIGTSSDNPPDNLISIEISSTGVVLNGSSVTNIQLWDYTSKSWKELNDTQSEYCEYLSNRIGKSHIVALK